MQIFWMCDVRMQKILHLRPILNSTLPYLPTIELVPSQLFSDLEDFSLDSWRSFHILLPESALLTNIKHILQARSTSSPSGSYSRTASNMVNF
jgi:hypothetical protein